MTFGERKACNIHLYSKCGPNHFFAKPPAKCEGPNALWRARGFLPVGVFLFAQRSNQCSKIPLYLGHRTAPKHPKSTMNNSHKEQTGSVNISQVAFRNCSHTEFSRVQINSVGFHPNDARRTATSAKPGPCLDLHLF